MLLTDIWKQHLSTTSTFGMWSNIRAGSCQSKYDYSELLASLILEDN